MPVLFAGLAAAAFLLGRIGQPGGPRAGPEYLAAFALVFAILSTVAAPVSNAVSRRIEANADRYALALVDDPREVLAAEIVLARRNILDPAPPDWAMILFFGHPAMAERIAMAEEAVRRAR